MHLYLKDIDEAGGSEEAATLRHQFTTEVKNATKNVNLTFYREVVQCLQDVTSRKDACGKKNNCLLHHILLSL